MTADMTDHTSSIATASFDGSSRPSRGILASREAYALTSDSDNGEDFRENDARAAQDNAALLGVSISRTQSRLKSPMTPKAEKLAAMEEQPGFFDSRFGDMETVDEVPDGHSSQANIMETPPDAIREFDSKPQVPQAYAPEESSSSSPSWPSPWRAGPKTFERSGETGQILGSVFRKRSSSGPEKKSRLPLQLPNLPRLFGSSNSKDLSTTADKPDQNGRSRYFPRFDGVEWSREAWDGFGSRSRIEMSSSEKTSRSGSSMMVARSPQASSNSGRIGSDVPSRPNMGLRRATSDQSLYLTRTLSKAPSLGDDSRFENVNEQINVRLKAIRDSWQDSNLRRSLPSLPNLPNLPKPTSMFSSSKVDLGVEDDMPRRTNRNLLSNGLESSSSPSISAGMSSARKGKSTKPGAADYPFFNEALEAMTGDLVILGGYRGSILREAQPPHRRLWLPLLKAGLNIRKVDLEVDFDDESRARETVIPDGMLTHIGPVDISRRLLKRLRHSENARSGKLRVHEYGYDWRLSPHRLSRQLLAFLASLPSNDDQTPTAERGAFVIAHSLGGLITRWAVNARPDLFAGVVYAGVPDTCVNILGWCILSTTHMNTANGKVRIEDNLNSCGSDETNADDHSAGPLRNGDPVLMNSKVLTAQVNLSIRTSIVLLPLDGKCFIDKDTNEEYPVDFYSVDDWS